MTGETISRHSLFPTIVSAGTFEDEEWSRTVGSRVPRPATEPTPWLRFGIRTETSEGEVVEPSAWRIKRKTITKIDRLTIS